MRAVFKTDLNEQDHKTDQDVAGNAKSATELVN